MIIKKGLKRFYKNVELEKDIKKDTQLLKQVKQEFDYIDNVIYVGLGPDMDIS